MLNRRLLLLLVVGLSLSTLAAADSVAFDAVRNHASMGGNGNARVTNLAAYQAAPNASVSGTHGVQGTIAYRAHGWDSRGRGPGMSAPEPDSLMLLSTGLFGIAGIVRRKLVRA